MTEGIEPGESRYPARWWSWAEDGRIQCDLCPRECRLADGQRGFCFVRAREGDGLILTTYGRSSGFCLDPIEKKPLAHFYPGSSVLSFGTAGCNLGCRFCQNWDISKAREQDRLVDQATPEAIAAAAVAAQAQSVAFTYNDPTIFAEYAIDVAEACHERDVRTVAVTAGYISPAPRRELYARMDAANVDLKGFTEEFYRKVTGSHLAPVLDTLTYLAQETSVWLELTTLVIPGYNDADEDIAAEAQWIVETLGPDVPLHFSAFHPDFKMLDVPPTPAATLRRARARALEAGLRYVYVGNVHDREGEATYCPGCGEAVIARDWYEILDYRLDEAGRCRSCGTAIPGRFGDRAGHFGRRRQVVRLAVSSPSS
jgi:pyruvate formate lyase activating enzyme